MSLRAERSNLPLLGGDCHVDLRSPRNDNLLCHCERSEANLGQPAVALVIVRLAHNSSLKRKVQVQAKLAT
jgi:hypothetical protein